MTFHVGNLAATSYADTNIAADTWIEESKYVRRVKRFGFTGGTTDHTVEARIMYGNRIIADGLEIVCEVNAANGIRSGNLYTISSKEVCLPSEDLQIILNGTITTNAGMWYVDIEEVPMPRRRGFRGRGRRFRGRGRRGYRRGGYRRRY